MLWSVVGGLGGAVLLATLAALFAARRRRDDDPPLKRSTPQPTPSDDDRALRRALHEAEWALRVPGIASEDADTQRLKRVVARLDGELDDVREALRDSERLLAAERGTEAVPPSPHALGAPGPEGAGA